MRLISDPLKLITALITFLAAGIISVVLGMLDLLIAAIVFGIIATSFLIVAIDYCIVVTISSDGIETKRLFRKKIKYNWKDVNELGVIGTKVIKAKLSKKSGRRFIYVTENILDSEKRFDMGLKWPPKDKQYVPFSYKTLKYIRKYYKKTVILYNAGKIAIDKPFEEDRG